MGREGRRAGSNHPEDEEDCESFSVDSETPGLTGKDGDSPGTSQTTFENDSDPVDSFQQTTSGDGGGISIRDRLQTESSEGIFADKDLVRPNAIIDEGCIVGHDDQLGRIVDNPKPILQSEGIPDMLLSGLSETEKSLITHAACRQTVELCGSQGKTFGVLFIDCGGSKTTDRATYRLVKTAADDLGVKPGAPQIGVSTDQKLERPYGLMCRYYDGAIFILDEIDMPEEPCQEAEYNSLIYQLLRVRKLVDFDDPTSLTTITNYADFMKDLNSRTQSSYNPNDTLFDNHDANQFYNIPHNQRNALKPESLADDVVPLVAAFGSQTHGDVRKVTDLLRWAGELVEWRGADTVTETDIYDAQEKYTENHELYHISGVSTWKRLSIHAVAATTYYIREYPEWISAGPAFKIYQFTADTMDVDQYSREMFVNHVTGQSTHGALDFERRSKGRGRGMHMYFSLPEDPETIMETTREDPRFEDLVHEGAIISVVVCERLKQFRSKN